MSPTRRRSRAAVDLAQSLGASARTSVQVLTLYIPAKDQHGRTIKNRRRWVMQGASLLAQVGGGVTIMPPARGGWLSPTGKMIWEDTILVYSYIRASAFLEHLEDLRAFLHDLGRETGQGEVVVEFGDSMYHITEFDSR